MKNPVYTTKFKKEYSAYMKRQKNIAKIDDIIVKLINEEKLPVKNRDHALHGEYDGCRSCHIEPDWVLIYEITGSDIYFHRTGSHSNLYE